VRLGRAYNTRPSSRKGCPNVFRTRTALVDASRCFRRYSRAARVARGLVSNAPARLAAWQLQFREKRRFPRNFERTWTPVDRIPAATGREQPEMLQAMDVEKLLHLAPDCVFKPKHLEGRGPIFEVNVRFNQRVTPCVATGRRAVTAPYIRLAVRGLRTREPSQL
jgi:hypothetical protein